MIIEVSDVEERSTSPLSLKDEAKHLKSKRRFQSSAFPNYCSCQITKAVTPIKCSIIFAHWLGST